jgi:hypothetical protein
MEGLTMKGYKVFNSDFTCRGFQYEVGKTYEIDGDISLCGKGFHFCLVASDCFSYYSFNPNNRVAEIEASDIEGETIHGDNKSVTKKITIVREINWQEVLTIVNTGKYNTGLCNTGNMNTGDWNTGDMNTGDWNTGDMNTGDMNTGDWNTGDMNTGDWNTTNFSNGVFCTNEPKILIFDTQSELTLREWRDTEAYRILNRIQTVFWVESSNMTNQEKELHPEHETTGGFLKNVPMVEAAEKWWNELNDKEKQIIKDIPNFDSEKFYNIVGIRV